MISGLSEDLNIIQQLDTLPNAEGGLTAEALKRKFDESGLIIQEFINEVIIPAINYIDRATEEEIDSIREALQALDDDIAESVVNLTHAKITVTKTGDTYTANMTYEEVSTALAEGRTLYCSCGDIRLPYLRSITAGPHIFACIDGTDSYFVQILPSEVLFKHLLLALREELPDGSPNPSYFSITDAGVVSLKPDYRGSGKTSYPESVGNGTQAALPEKLVIPDTIDGIQVTALAPGMFYGNTRVKEVTIPDAVTAIPESFAMYAINLRTVNNTENVTSIGNTAFAATRVKQAFFPNLTEMGTMVFALDGYLETVDIGKVTAIPERAFADCAFLERVLGGENVTSIGPRAFYHTHKLRDLPLLAHVTSVADYAFFGSRICTSLPAGGDIGTKAFPTVDNTKDFWTGVPYTPCKNRITTKLSQTNPEWAKESFLKDDARGYGAGCALFCVMHIHSAITGKYYSDPRDFVDELKNDKSEANLSRFLYYDNWPGLFINVSKMFDALKYRTEVHGLADGDDLTAADYKALVDALAAGAYVYSQAGLYDEWRDNDYFDGGHSVVLYGINELGEVCVLDSAIRHEPFRESGFEPDADVYTYTMPYQNLVGASSNFVIVYPPNVEVKSAPTTLPNPHKLIINGAVQAEYDGSEEVTIEIPEGGESGGQWRLINTITTTEDALSRVTCTTDSNGNPISLTEVYVKAVLAASGTVSGSNFFYLNNQYFNGPTASTKTGYGSLYANGILNQVSVSNGEYAQWYLHGSRGIPDAPYITKIELCGQSGGKHIPIGTTLQIWGR